jgi:hypothetical protein
VTTHWKYKVVVLDIDAKTSTKRLTDYGSAGWELVAIGGSCETQQLAYLKRPAEKSGRDITL